MKKILSSIGRIIGNSYILLGIRLVLGVTFILAAVAKLPEQAKFVDAVTGLGLLPWHLARTYGLFLPWLELAVGLGLVTGFLSRVCASASILMIISFLIANGTAVFKLHERECYSCFGEFFVLKTSDALLVDVIIVVMALVILIYGGGFCELGSLIWSRIRRTAPIQSNPVSSQS